MPERVYSAQNTGGRSRATPEDAIEEANRNFAAQSAWRQQQMAREDDSNATATQLALQRLRSEDYRFGQNRADQFAMHREDLADRHDQRQFDANSTKAGWDRQDALFGKQFDFMKGRAEVDDKWREDEKAWARDPNLNPALKRDERLAEIQADIAAMKLARDQKDTARIEKAADVAPLTDLTPDEADEYASLQSTGQTGAASNLAIKNRRREKAGTAATNVGKALGSAFKRFNAKDKAWGTSDGTEGEGAAIESQFASVLKSYMDSGLSEAEAMAKAGADLTGQAEAADSDWETDWFADKSASLLQRLKLR